MITTVTLNAAIDKAYQMGHPLEVGKVQRVLACRNSAGGKGLNVARVADLCGESVQATGLIGGHNGAYLESLLKETAVVPAFVQTEKETRSCINILTPDGLSTEFLEPGEPMNEEDGAAFLKKMEQLLKTTDVLTLSGSLPPGLPDYFYANIIMLAKKAGKPVILDSSGASLKEGILAKPTLVKPNREEFEVLLGHSLDRQRDLLRAAQELVVRGIEKVVVSMGEKGAILVTGQGMLWGKPPQLEAVNPTGCGDSMVAAFAVAMVRQYSLEESLRFAVAVSAANAMNKRTGYYEKEDFDFVFPNVLVDNV